MTNEDWLKHFGLAWALKRKGKISNDELHTLKAMALKAKPFAPSESFPDITEEVEARAQKNMEFFRVAKLLVPSIVDELLKLRKAGKKC